ncbi:MAG: histidine kinase [Ramlibacter sp.]|nr:histidine kinase [Ramlibacter sp.]
MSLRFKINLIVGLLTLLFVAGLLALQIDNLRDSVHEEVVAANRVAAQLLKHIAVVHAAEGSPPMLSFLRGVGRVRSNDITLTDSQGRTLYQSPPSRYKAGRDAPRWFERMISPEPSSQTYDFKDGQLQVRAHASRAALDAWDSLLLLILIAVAALLAVNLLVFWLVGRAVRPLQCVVDGLVQLEAGRFDVSLPPLAGTEAAAIGAAFNRMVSVLRDHIETQGRAVLAERQLSDSRELTRWIDQRLEQERRMIARELHDELGQSVTAIRSLALSVSQRVKGRDAESGRAAQLIADESSRLYDAMHGLIPRLTPLLLDSFGLGEALMDLAARIREAHPEVRLELSLAPGDLPPLTPETALALYRAAQEGITNALRHGKARQLELSLECCGESLVLALSDDGEGLAADWQQRPGHHGLRWLAERVQGQCGQFVIENLVPRGVRLQVTLPLATGMTQ